MVSIVKLKPPNKCVGILANRSPPKSESEAGPFSSPRSLKKFALGLRQSRSLERGAFAVLAKKILLCGLEVIAIQMRGKGPFE